MNDKQPQAPAPKYPESHCPYVALVHGALAASLGATNHFVYEKFLKGTPLATPNPPPPNTPIDINSARYYRSARLWGMCGMLYSGSICAAEGLRGKTDYWNDAVGGAIVGGLTGVESGLRFSPSNAIVGGIAAAVVARAFHKYSSKNEADADHTTNVLVQGHSPATDDKQAPTPRRSSPHGDPAFV